MVASLRVIIPSHKRPGLLQRTLDSVAQCSLPDGYRGTIVVENGGQWGAERVCADADARLRVRYLFHPEGNKSGALNRAIATVDDELLVFLDDDVRVVPGLLTAYAEAATAHPVGRMFGGPTGVDLEVKPPEWLTPYLPASAKGWSWQGPVDPVAEPVFLGFNWAAFADDLRRVGGFNEEVGPGAATQATGQDSDMQRRLLSRGLLGRYVPEAFVWHFVPRERSNPEWALHRAFRNGVNWSLRFQYDSLKTRSPHWLIRPALSVCAKAVLRLLQRTESTRFDHRYWYQHLRGLAHGRRCRLSKGRRGAEYRRPPGRHSPDTSFPVQESLVNGARRQQADRCEDPGACRVAAR